eukprot:6432592-Pyramimonas_sp.AAC.1
MAHEIAKTPFRSSPGPDLWGSTLRQRSRRRRCGRKEREARTERELGREQDGQELLDSVWRRRDYVSSWP